MQLRFVRWFLRTHVCWFATAHRFALPRLYVLPGVPLCCDVVCGWLYLILRFTLPRACVPRVLPAACAHYYVVIAFAALCALCAHAQFVRSFAFFHVAACRSVYGCARLYCVCVDYHHTHATGALLFDYYARVATTFTLRFPVTYVVRLYTVW